MRQIKITCIIAFLFSNKSENTFKQRKDFRYFMFQNSSHRFECI